MNLTIIQEIKLHIARRIADMNIKIIQREWHAGELEKNGTLTPEISKASNETIDRYKAMIEHSYTEGEKLLEEFRMIIAKANCNHKTVYDKYGKVVCYECGNVLGDIINGEKEDA